MTTYQIEQWEPFWKDAQEIIRDHFIEVGEDLELDPDVSHYGNLWDNGNMIILTAREEGTMIGYLLMVVRNHFHSKDYKIAMEDGMFVHKDHRRGEVARTMMKIMDSVLVSLGVKRVYYTTRTKAPVDALFLRHGMKEMGRIYAKELG